MSSLDWDVGFQQQASKTNLAEQVKQMSIKPEPSPGGDHTKGSDPHASEEDKQDPGQAAADASMLNKALHSRLVQIKSSSQLEVQQNDPNSPLFSVKSFEELRLAPELLKGVYCMGFNAPSKIQETALPLLLVDPPKNMIAQSQSGTGKTAAFVLTMLSRVDTNEKYPQALCLAPTYELALQIGKVAQDMGQFINGLHIRYAIRGQTENIIKGRCLTEQIVIGTPGTTLDWCHKFNVIDMKKIKVFVLDEADVMIATQGHQDQSIRIKKKLLPTCQMMLFSATYEEKVMKFAMKIITDPVTIRLKREEESLDNIKQYYVLCSTKDEKFEALSNIYGVLSIGQAIIFCQTKATARWLSEKMKSEGHAVALLIGDLTIDERVSVLMRFKEAKEKLLVTTNLMARGIDIEQVTLVVNFDLPVDLQQEPDFETYLHRIGRTGRFGKTGLAINFIDGPRTMKKLQRIEQHFGRRIERLLTDDADEIEKIV